MKIRLINSFDDPRLFCDILDAKYEETANKIYEENKNPFLNSSSTPLPVFNALNFEKEIMPAPKSLNEAFGEPPKDNKSPF